MRVPPAPLDDGYDVRGPRATRVGKESALVAVPVFYQPAEGIRLCRSHISLAGSRSLRNTAAEDGSDLPIPHRTRACVRNDDGRCSELFEVAHGLRQGCVLSLLLFNVFFAGIFFVALERYSVRT